MAISDILKGIGGDFAKGMIKGALGDTVGGSITSAASSSTTGAQESGKESPETGDIGRDTINAIRDLQDDIISQKAYSKELCAIGMAQAELTGHVIKGILKTNELLEKLVDKKGLGALAEAALSAAEIAGGAGLAGGAAAAAKKAIPKAGIGKGFGKLGGRALGAAGSLYDAYGEYQQSGNLGSAASVGVGGLAGAEAGAAGGAALGTAILPGVGTVVGGIGGGILGSMAGSSLGKGIYDWFSGGDKKEDAKGIQKAQLSELKFEANKIIFQTPDLRGLYTLCIGKPSVGGTVINNYYLPPGEEKKKQEEDGEKKPGEAGPGGPDGETTGQPSETPSTGQPVVPQQEMPEQPAEQVQAPAAGGMSPPPPQEITGGVEFMPGAEAAPHIAPGTPGAGRRRLFDRTKPGYEPPASKPVTDMSLPRRDEPAKVVIPSTPPPTQAPPSVAAPESAPIVPIAGGIPSPTSREREAGGGTPTPIQSRLRHSHLGGNINESSGTADDGTARPIAGDDAVGRIMSLNGLREKSPNERALIQKFLKDGGHGGLSIETKAGAWCAATVGSALRQSGIKDIPASMGGNLASSYLNWGSHVDRIADQVKRGDVVVFNKRGVRAGESGAHVGMATGLSRVNKAGKTEYQTIEGNTGNKVALRWHDPDKDKAEFRRAREGIELPKDGQTRVAGAEKIRPLGESKTDSIRPQSPGDLAPSPITPGPGDRHMRPERISLPSGQQDIGAAPPSGEGSGGGKAAAEQYLGRPISNHEYDMLIRATHAESGGKSNQQEQAMIMGSILNRARTNPNGIEGALMAKNQFQSVTGTAKHRGPSENYRVGPHGERLSSIESSAGMLSRVPRNQKDFTAASAAAYKAGTNIGYRNQMLSKGGSIYGGSVFRSHMAEGPTSEPTSKQAGQREPRKGVQESVMPTPIPSPEQTVAPPPTEYQAKMMPQAPVNTGQMAMMTSADLESTRYQKPSEPPQNNQYINNQYGEKDSDTSVNEVDPGYLPHNTLKDLFGEMSSFA